MKKPRAGSFARALFDLEEEIGKLPADDSLESSAEDIAGRVRELGEEQREKFDNMPEGLQQGDTGQALETRADRCAEIADEFDELDFSDRPDADVDAGVKKEGEGDANTPKDKGEDNADDYWQSKLDDIQAIDFTCD